MTRDEARQLLPIIQAYADGKKILLDGGNLPINPKFDEDPSMYSIAPEPTLRPWKPEEVPVGALIRYKDGHIVQLIVGAIGCEVRYGYNDFYSLENVLERCEWKWPQEPNDAWRPCGVVE